MKNHLLDEREKRSAARKIAKEQFDKKITLSNGFADELVVTGRLLDEGGLPGASIEVREYITKGTLRKFYNDLPDDFVGTVDLGHMEFAIFPFILGHWTKKDLSIVEKPDGRVGLDVSLHLDKESVFVRELRRLPYDIGMSATFRYDLDYDLTDQFNMDVINYVDIFKIALVGECGNVDSDGLKLNLREGEEDMSAIKRLMGLEDAPKPEETVEEVATEETTEEVSEETTAEEETTEEVAGDEAEETEEGADASGVMQEMLETIRTLTASVAEKDAQIEALASHIETLETEVREYKDRDKEFMSNLKDLKLALNPTMEEKEVTKEENSKPRYSDANDGKGVLV